MFKIYTLIINIIVNVKYDLVIALYSIHNNNNQSEYHQHKRLDSRMDLYRKPKYFFPLIILNR